MFDADGGRRLGDRRPYPLFLRPLTAVKTVAARTTRAPGGREMAEIFISDKSERREP